MMNSRQVKIAIYILTIALLVLVTQIQLSQRPTALPSMEGNERLRIHLPKNFQADRKYPLVLALSPDGNAKQMLDAWILIPDKLNWIVAASNEFRKGIDYEIVFGFLNKELDELESKYPIDKNKIILTGLSGGAMAAHSFANTFPHRIAAVVANTGMMDEQFRPGALPEKFAVFLASQTDFRYLNMKKDKQTLDSLGWRTKWIEFPGGHTIAPKQTYEQAAEWLASQWRPQALSIEKLLQLQPTQGSFQVVGYIAHQYHCPPCDAGMKCKPCMRNNVLVSTKNEQLASYPSAGNYLVIFSDEPDTFQFGVPYRITFKVLSTKTSMLPINDLVLESATVATE